MGVSREQAGTALRRLAQDLIAERRWAAALEHANRELRARLEAPQARSAAGAMRERENARVDSQAAA